MDGIQPSREQELNLVIAREKPINQHFNLQRERSNKRDLVPSNMAFLFLTFYYNSKLQLPYNDLLLGLYSTLLDPRVVQD